MSRFENEVDKIMASPWIYPGLPDRAPENLMISFSLNFSLGTWTTWSIFLQDMQWYVRRIQWRRQADRIELSGCSPTTFGSESRMKKGHAEGLIDSARAVLEREGDREAAGLMIDGVYGSVLLTGYEAPLRWVLAWPGSERLDTWLSQAAAAADRYLPYSSAMTADGAAMSR
jgi:hypothetical protein